MDVVALAQILDGLINREITSLKRLLEKHRYRSFTAFLRTVQGIVVNGKKVSLRPATFFDVQQKKNQVAMLAKILIERIKNDAPGTMRVKAERAASLLTMSLGVAHIDYERLGYTQEKHRFSTFIEDAEGLSLDSDDGVLWVGVTEK
jgi:hypothetical protein